MSASLGLSKRVKHDSILEVTRQFDLLFHVLGQDALVLCEFFHLHHRLLFLCPLSSVLGEVQLALIFAEAGAIRQKHKFIFIVLAQSPQFLLYGPALVLPLHLIPLSPLVLLNEGLLIRKESAEIELVFSHMILLLHRYYKSKIIKGA